MEEQLNVYTVYAIQLAAFGLLCTLIAYLARWVENRDERKHIIRHWSGFHIHLRKH